jgi:serine protease inhibitor
MMHQVVECRSNPNMELGCTILEMPYKGKRLRMLIFLSNEPSGFDAMEAKFTLLDFDAKERVGRLFAQVQVGDDTRVSVQLESNRSGRYV